MAQLVRNLNAVVVRKCFGQLLPVATLEQRLPLYLPVVTDTLYINDG